MNRLRLVLVLVFALLPLLASGFWRLGPPRATPLGEARMPDVLDGHRVRGEERLDPVVLSMLVPEWYAMRLYADDAGGSAWVYVALYAGHGEQGGAHDPAVCYPAQGWEASPAQETELSLGSDPKPVVKVLAAIQGGKEELVLYWFQPARRWPAHGVRELVLRMLDRLQGRPEYAFVRLSTQIDRYDPTSRPAAEKRLERLAAELAPWVRRVVSGDVD
jgi:EpsI family protein